MRKIRYKIRKARASDAKKAFPIYFHPSVNKYMYYRVLSAKRFSHAWKSFLKEKEIFIVEYRNEILGFGGLERDIGRCKHVAEICMIAVHPEHHRQGIGHALLTFLIKHAKKEKIKRLQLIVDADNPKAFRIYREFGFKREGKLKKFTKRKRGFTNCYLMAKIIR